MAINEVQKRITRLPVGDEYKKTLTTLIAYFTPRDADALLEFFEKQPSRAEKLCLIMSEKFKAIREENTTLWDKALADELSLLMKADT